MCLRALMLTLCLWCRAVHHRHRVSSKARMYIRLLLLTLCLWCVHHVHAAREEDLVEYLPYLDPQPDFNHYAGYLNVDENKKFFYWFVESENDPANDPVVLWLNGGPGCSSLTGFLVELGPWRVHSSGEFLTWFEHRWNKVANIIFMESPQCVGYSYALDGDCSTGDDQVAADNYAALKDFFEGFPEFQDNEFFVTGESYAGIYVPTLSEIVMEDPEFNFKGFAVGNGVTDWNMMDNFLVYFSWVRGVIGTDLYEDILEHCCNYNWTYCDSVGNRDNSECNDAIRDMNRAVWSDGLNPYNLYDECDGGAPYDGRAHYDDTVGRWRMAQPGTVPMMTQEARDEYQQRFREELALHGTIYSGIPCTDTSDRENYLNKPEVREALHVPEFVQYWEPCSSEVGAGYTYDYSTMEQQYLNILDQGHRGLIFNGDLDMACNHLGDYYFAESLQQPMFDDYTPWYYDDEHGWWQIAGYVSQYTNLKFLTVKGAGHFVPTDKPWPAYIMWETFLNDTHY